MNILVNLNDVKNDILKNQEEMKNALYNIGTGCNCFTDVSNMFANCSNLSSVTWQDLFIPNETGRKLELI